MDSSSDYHQNMETLLLFKTAYKTALDINDIEKTLTTIKYFDS